MVPVESGVGGDWTLAVIPWIGPAETSDDVLPTAANGFDAAVNAAMVEPIPVTGITDATLEAVGTPLDGVVAGAVMLV